MKKTLLALALTLALMLVTPLALAAGNATIAVRGRDGFDDYISSMFVWDGRLMMSSYDVMYTWSPEEGLSQIEGYVELDEAFQPQEDEDGERYVQIGEERIDLEENENAYLYTYLYPAGDKLYRMGVINGENGATDVLLVEINLEDGAFAMDGGYIDLGDQLIEDYGDGYTGVNALEQSCYADGVLYGMFWGMDGRMIAAIDLETGDMDTMEFDTDNEILSIAPYDEGRLLLSTYAYDEEYNATVSFQLYDVESEELTEIGALEPGSGSFPSGVCYDEARGKLYFVRDGSVWRADVTEDGLGEPEAFGDMPIEIYSDAQPVLLGDLYVLCSYDGIVGRDVTVDKMPEQHLTIADAGYTSVTRSAYFDFTALHPEFAVSIANSGMSSDELIQSMMTQSSDTDIFIMNAYDPSYLPLLRRGYMAELGGSEKLRAYADSVYPVISAVGQMDGELYAVPVTMYGDVYSLNVTLLTEKLGFSEEDIPTTWPEMCAMVAKLADGRLEDVPEASPFSPGYTQDDARRNFFGRMVEDYMLWLDADEAHMARANDVLSALLDAFAQIDWTALGMPEEYEEGTFEYYEENILLETNSVTPSQLQYMNRDEECEWRIMPLSVAEGEPALIGAETTLAFVNPYSKHREEAIEYLELMLPLIEKSTRVALCPQENEPVENSYYQERLESYEQMISDTQTLIAQAEAAGDDETLAMQEENLKNLQQGKEWYEQFGRWEISPEAIELYRALAENLTPELTSFWGDDSAYDSVNAYLEGTIGAEQFVSKMEEKLQMKRLEDM